jgi:hypothetical protein
LSCPISPPGLTADHQVERCAQVNKPLLPALIDHLEWRSNEHTIRDAISPVLFGEDHRFSLTAVFREGIEHAMERLNYRPRSLGIEPIRSILTYVRTLNSYTWKLNLPLSMRPPYPFFSILLRLFRSCALDCVAPNMRLTTAFLYVQ